MKINLLTLAVFGFLGLNSAVSAAELEGAKLSDQLVNFQSQDFLKKVVNKNTPSLWTVYSETTTNYSINLRNTLASNLDQPYSLPFIESFEDSSESRQFWTNVYVSGDKDWTYRAGSTGGTLTRAFEGEKNATFVSESGEGTPATKLVSPVISVGSNNAAILKFYHANPKWVNDINELKVFYRLSPTSPWVELFHQVEAVEEWTGEEIQLPAVSETMQFAFEGINYYGRGNVIDNVQVLPGTLPNVYTLPFNETFENSSNSRPDWSQQRVLGDADWSYGTGSSGGSLNTAFEGTLNARFVGVEGTDSPVTKLISPVISAGTAQYAYLDFQHANPTWESSVNKLKVYYRVNSDSPWVELFYQTESLSQWTQKKIQIPVLSQKMQFAFEAINNYGRANVIDDVKVVEGLLPVNATLPFHETFEDLSVTRFGWTQEYVVGQASWTIDTGSNSVITTARTGTKNARFVSTSGENSPVTKLISPRIQVGGVTEGYLEFYHGNPEFWGDVNYLKVYYRLSPNSPWVQIMSNQIAKNSWTKATVQLPVLIDGMQIAFEGINNFGYANVIDDVKIMSGEIPPLPAVCGINNVSNEMENGIGSVISYQYANDFRVNANSAIDITQISFNLITQSIGLNSVKFSIVEDNNGVPGTNVVHTFTAAPSQTQTIGQNFGFTFGKYTFNLAEALRVENPTQTHKTFWLIAEEAVVASGTNAYFEITTAENSSIHNMYVYDTEEGEWLELDGEGVFTIVGDCNTLGLDETLSLNDKLTFYPNPVADVLTIEHKLGIEKVEVTNLTGQNVLSTKSVAEGTVNVSSLNKGVYIVTATLKDGTKQTFKVIKK